MALDFPASPSVGQKYPVTPIGGIPTYTWDGEKWTTIGGAVGGKTPIYSDGSVAMAAQLTVQSTPVAATDATSKSYVDGKGAFASGTVMLFYQAAAPTGWTKVTTQNDKALRVVSGSGGVAGGTNAFSTVMAQTVVGNTTITTATAPAHSVSGSASVSGNVPWIVYGFNVAGNATPSAYGGGSTGISSSGSISGTAAGSGGAHNHTITMAIQYIDIILASKD